MNNNDTPSKSEIEALVNKTAEKRIDSYVSDLLQNIGIVAGIGPAIIGLLISSPTVVHIGLVVASSSAMVNAIGTAAMKKKVLQEEMEMGSRLDEKMSEKFALLGQSLASYQSYNLKKTVAYVGVVPVSMVLNNMLQLNSGMSFVLGLGLGLGALQLVKKMRIEEEQRNPNGRGAYMDSKKLLQNVLKSRYNIDYAKIISAQAEPKKPKM